MVLAVGVAVSLVNYSRLLDTEICDAARSDRQDEKRYSL